MSDFQVKINHWLLEEPYLSIQLVPILKIKQKMVLNLNIMPIFNTLLHQ